MDTIDRSLPARRHARASATSRAARDVNKSAVTPLEIAFSVDKIADQYSDGIQSRCHHFVTMPAEAPISDAIARRAPCASFGPQSSMIDRNEVKSVMPRVIGLIVLKCKAIQSLDCEMPLGHNVRMAEVETESQFKQGFMRRVKEARISRALKQWEIADALGMAQDKYKQYETRSLLPHHLIGRFCIICRVDEKWLVTGRGKMAPQEPAEPVQKAAKPRSKRAA